MLALHRSPGETDIEFLKMRPLHGLQFLILLLKDFTNILVERKKVKTPIDFPEKLMLKRVWAMMLL